MFTSLTWSDFFTCSALALAVYYLGVLLTCYRRQLRRLLAHAFRRPLPPGADSLAGPALTGDIFYTQAEELQVAPPAGIPAPGTLSPLPFREGLSGELVHLFRETEILVTHAAATASGKEDFLSLLGLLAANCPSLCVSPYREPAGQLLLALCRERLPFELNRGDLDRCWHQHMPSDITL